MSAPSMIEPDRIADARRWGGLAAIGGVAAFLVVVIPLHFLQPAYDPAHQLMSELALGPYGGAMVVAFAGLGVAAFGVQASIGACGASKGLRVLLTAAALLFVAAGLFPLGETAEIHIFAIASAFVASVLSMYLFPAMAGRASRFAPRAISWTLAAGVAASVALGHSVVPMGIAQRAAACFLLSWLAVPGWRSIRGRGRGMGGQ